MRALTTNTVMNTQTLGGNARYNFTYKEFFTLDLAANIQNSTTKYDSDQKNQRYVNSTYTAETNWTFLKIYQFNADFNYYVYTVKTNDFSQTIPILNVWLSRFILKANAGEIKVGVSNVLDKSLSVTQTVSQNYFATRDNQQPWFATLWSALPTLNKQLNPFWREVAGPGGGMRMMIQN